MHPLLVAPQMGRTAMQVAALRGHVEIVELLLKHGADVEAKDEVWRRLVADEG